MTDKEKIIDKIHKIQDGIAVLYGLIDESNRNDYGAFIGEMSELATMVAELKTVDETESVEEVTEYNGFKVGDSVAYSREIHYGFYVCSHEMIKPEIQRRSGTIVSFNIPDTSEDVVCVGVPYAIVFEIESGYEVNVPIHDLSKLE